MYVGSRTCSGAAALNIREARRLATGGPNPLALRNWTRLTLPMLRAKSNQAIVASLVFAVFLWGGNNTGVKFLVGSWPPIWVGCTRFLCAGLLMLALLRHTQWLGTSSSLSVEDRRGLWWRSGLSLAVYIVAFNWALRFTSASHVALYLGASPVWALASDGRLQRNWRALARYAAALLAFAGVLILFWPTLRSSPKHLIGELLGLAASVLWAYHGHQCRSLGSRLSGVEITAHTMWRAAIWLAPLALLEACLRPIPWRANLVLVQAYCVLAGGVAAFALWNNALRQWPTSQVFLFNNLVPLSTMSWAHVCLGEAVTRTYFIALILIVGAVLLAQANWPRILGAFGWVPE